VRRKTRETIKIFLPVCFILYLLILLALVTRYSGSIISIYSTLPTHTYTRAMVSQSATNAYKYIIIFNTRCTLHGGENVPIQKRFFLGTYMYIYIYIYNNDNNNNNNTVKVSRRYHMYIGKLVARLNYCRFAGR